MAGRVDNPSHPLAPKVSMVLERFLSWVAAAPARARMDAARTLVAAYSRPETDGVRRDHLDRMVAVLLDDPAVSVRRALSEAAATSTDVPRHMVVALTRDDSIVAVPALQASPLLSAADLAAAVAIGDEAVHGAVASRAGVPASVAALLAQDAQRATILTLCQNQSAELTATSLRLILDRFGADADVREAMLDRDDLDAALRHEIVAVTARVLTDWAVSRAWMSERRADCVKRESLEKATVTIAATQGRRTTKPDLEPFVAYLRAEDRLTPALLLRSLLSGETAFFEAALGHLAGMAAHRVAGPARAPSSLAFASLYTKAAMPAPLLPMFRAAVAAGRRFDASGRDGPDVLQAAVAHVRAACEKAGGQSGLAALLDRLEAEALRDDTRRRRRVLQVASPISPRAEIPVFTMPSRTVFRLPFRTAA